MTGAELAPLELAGRLALAFGLAVFLGLAFEEVYKREDRSSPGGVRTFPMLAVSGAMLYLIEPQRALAFVAGLLALALWLHSYLRNAPPRPNSTSLMIPVSNLLAYLIGPVALTQPPWMVVAVSVTAVILLGTREQLHRLIEVVPQEELLTAGKFLILIEIILPLVPSQPITAATALTPYPLEAVAAAALVGPAQVAARLVEFFVLHRAHPLMSARIAAALHPIGVGIFALTGVSGAAVFVVLYGAGNGLLTIARGTVPLALFGPLGYGERTGLLGAPARAAQAFAPLLFGLLLDAVGVSALLVSAGLCLAALSALFCLRAKPPA